MSSASSKVTKTEHPILDVIADRWSPYLFEPRILEPAHLSSILEAARWAASSFNEQPWSFIVAEKDDAEGFQKMVGCLLEANQPWASNASALLLTVVSKTFTRNGNPNRVAEHDLGLAVGNLSIQATSLGLAVHQMAGVNLSAARQAYNIPEGYEPVTVVAVGYAASPDANSDAALAARDSAPRTRKPLSEFVFRGSWGNL